MLKILNWFKKKETVISKAPTMNINGLYSARLEDINNIKQNISTLTTQLEALNNRLDSLPPIPDHSQFARKDQANIFTQKQTFNRGAYLNNQKIQGLLAPSEAGDATHKKYVDDADNAKLREAKTYTDNIKTQLETIITTGDTNTLNAAKAYTDDEIIKIPKGSGYYKPFQSGLRGGIQVNCKDLDISGGNILYDFTYELPIGTEHIGKELQVSFYFEYQREKYTCPVLCGIVNNSGNIVLNWNMIQYTGTFVVANMKIRFDTLYYKISVKDDSVKI